LNLFLVLVIAQCRLIDVGCAFVMMLVQSQALTLIDDDDVMIIGV
jgi:hypothetical protein